MVQAIIAGRKTQTRRVITCSNSLVDGQSYSQKSWNSFEFDFTEAWVDPGPSPAGNPGPYLKVPSTAFGTVHRIYPKLQPGVILWVRETWGHEFAGGYLYKATHQHLKNVGGLTDHRWKPSIHMPKQAARIWCEVTQTMPQQLTSISEADAIQEGVWLDDGVTPAGYTVHGMPHWPTAIGCFQNLWQSINGAESWNHLHVWATSFKVLSTNGKPNGSK